MNLNKIVIILLGLFIGFALLFSGYARWNAANPEKTCARCHEINPSVGEWQHSAHRDVRCTACHGTALSSGIHSLKEKAGMVFSHIDGKKNPEEIRMNEKQVLELSDRCAKCHQSEYKKWLSGGHSANYASIFMNGKHNLAETPYWACLRCHGMFYDGNIKTLLQKPDRPDGVWKLKNPAQALLPTMPCLACHSIHNENTTLGEALRYDEPRAIFYTRESRNPAISWYVRDAKMHIRADQLMQIAIFSGSDTVRVASDPGTKLCLQCHSPNFRHQAGSEDDRTPTGVHEGISCVVCHAPHSNDARNSCTACHPGLSNCGLDVRKMNTTYLNPDSPNNIHSVSCKSCHAGEEIAKSEKKKKSIQG